MVVFASAVPVGAVLFGLIFGPRKPNDAKRAPYECGIVPVGEPWRQIRSSAYPFLIAFLLFAVEIVFLFPWAAAYHALDLFALVSGLTFIAMLAGGLVYVWRKGGLEWS